MAQSEPSSLSKPATTLRKWLRPTVMAGKALLKVVSSLMASFLAVLKDIGKFAIGVVTNQQVTELVTALDPPLGSVLNQVGTAILAIEAKYKASTAPAPSGETKHSEVVDSFNQQLALAQQALGAQGKQLTYDGDALNKAISDNVTSLNSYAALIQSFKLIDTPRG
jgi:hypothetical protein